MDVETEEEIWSGHSKDILRNHLRLHRRPMHIGDVASRTFSPFQVIDLTGKTTVKVLPCPCIISTSILPPVASSNCIDVANPRPIPLGLVVISGISNFGLKPHSSTNTETISSSSILFNQNDEHPEPDITLSASINYACE